MSDIPAHLRYGQDHLWARRAPGSNLVRIGARKDVVDILMVVQEDADWNYCDVVVGQSRTLCRLPLVGPPSRTYERGAEASTCNSRTNLQLQRSGGC